MYLAIFGDMEKQPLEGREGGPAALVVNSYSCERRIAAEWAENQGEAVLFSGRGAVVALAGVTIE